MREIDAALSQADFPSSRKDDVLTALSEACLNAIEHGNRLDNSRRVKVTMQDRDAAIVFRVHDQGRGFELPRTEAGGARMKEKWGESNPRGWGLFLISLLADDVRVMKNEDGQFYLEIHFGKNGKRVDAHAK